MTSRYPRTLSAFPLPPPSSRLGGFLAALLGRVAPAGRRRRATPLDLEATPDYLLRDLGFRDGRPPSCRSAPPE